MYYSLEETGKRIQMLRKGLKMTQEQFAKELGVTDRQVRRIESGQKGASIEVMVIIAAMCEVSLDYIILGK